MTRYEFEFGVYECHDRFIVAEPKEGAMIGKREMRMLIEMGKKHYERPFGFIANRVHHSSGHLAIFDMVKREAPLLSAVAIVIHTAAPDNFVQVGRQMLGNIPYAVVTDLESAKRFVLETLSDAGPTAT